MHVVAFAGQALGVLPPQGDVHEDGSAKKADHEVGQNHSVSSKVSWSILLQVDVRRDDAVQVTPADDDSNDHTSLVDTFNVVGAPSEGVWDRWIDTSCSEEDSDVLNGGIALIAC